MALPIMANFGVVRGTTASFTITLTSGNSSVPINLAGASANLVIGPYVSLTSVPTVSGGLILSANTGTIQIVMSGISTEIYSPQQYYIGLTLQNGNYSVIQNGSINFISPFNRAILPARTTYSIGVQDVTIGISSWEDGFIPIAVPSPPVLTTSGVYGDNQNG